VTRRVPRHWEPIGGRPEGGWIAPGVCGRPHLIGEGWAWWTCPVCAAFTAIERRRNSTSQISDRQRAMLAHFYPEETR